jgi:cell division protein FtsA
MLRLNNYICALDIGSTKIAAVVAEIKRKHVANIFFETLASRGIKRGVIIDSINLVDSVSKVLKSLKSRSGINIKVVHGNISGQDVVVKHSRAIIPLAERGNKVITLSDLEKVNEQARILASSLEEETLHQVPCSYTIDSRSNILNPLGLYSHRLEVDLYLICAKLSSVQSLSRVINQAGFEIKNLSFSGLATSMAVFKKDQKGLNILCDIGSDITELLVFEDSMLKDIEVLPLGGDDLTAGLSEILKIPFDLAEDVKKSYGIIGDYAQIRQDREILVKKSNIYKPIKQRAVSEILTSRAISLCQAIKDAVDKKVDSSQIDNFLTVGRTVLLDGFLEALENTLGISVKLGRLTQPDMVSVLGKEDALSPEKCLNYITPLGMVSNVLKGNESQLPGVNQPPKNPILNIASRIKEVYQEYF